MCKNKILYENYTPKVNSSHALKNYLLWESLTKDHKGVIMVSIRIATLCLFFQNFLFTHGIFS
jgi:hypothetical protein